MKRKDNGGKIRREKGKKMTEVTNTEENKAKGGKNQQKCVTRGKRKGLLLPPPSPHLYLSHIYPVNGLV